MDGILVVDKPKYFTSHDIVDFVRKKFSLRKVGHAGTLDPFATGILVLLIGRLTKQASKFVAENKEYEACLSLGVATDSLDGQGRIIRKEKVADYSLRQIQEAFGHFTGRIEQLPPMYSAVKYKGQRLYHLARKGIVVERQPRKIHIYKIEITKFVLPRIYFTLKCSKGTYVRVLCADIAGRLKCPGYMSELRRTSSGVFRIKQAVSLEQLKKISRPQLHQMLLNRDYKSYAGIQD